MSTITKRLGICLLTLALLAVGCSQSASDSEGASTDSTKALEPSGLSSGIDDDGTDGPAAIVPAGADTPGVTDDTITVSFIITDTTAVAAAFGWEVPTEGNREAQVAALVEDINARGGVAGRTIDAKVHVFNAITDGPVAEEALCNAITQDDQAFAVVMTGQFQENARPCYANAKTLMFDGTLYPVDDAGFDELAPYLWSPFLPSYDNLTAGMASSLTDSGWFSSGTVGVISIDSDLSRRAYEQKFVPVLDAAGVKVASFNTIDPTDGTVFENGLLQAIVNFKEANVDRVVAIGGSRLISWFINTAITQNFEPQYAVSSYDSPDFNIFNYGPQMAGATGISVLPGADVADDQWPFPANDAEAACVDIFSDAGLAIDDRATVRTGLMFCDALQLLAAAGDGAAEISAAGFGEAMWALDTSFETASVYSVQFKRGQYAGGGAFMPFAFEAGCECMVVSGSPIDFDG